MQARNLGRKHGASSSHRKLLRSIINRLLFKIVDNGPYNKPDNGGKEFVRDGAAAYTMALQWYVEEDKAYAEKAIEIFNAWAQTLESVVNHNRQLKVGTAGIKYLNAAEIIKHTYKGWNAKDRKAFEDMVINIWYPVIKD